MENSKIVSEPVVATLADLGIDEAWLEKWFQDSPRRLGLGPSIRIVRSQLSRPSGSGRPRLDLQAVDETVEDRVYDIELMRGELDADHGFRALDYWAREQRNDDTDREHRPVIVAERIRGTRYWTLLETLAEKLGMVALEVRCVTVDAKPVVWLEPVIIPEDLQPDRTGELRFARGNLTEDDWRAKTTEEFQAFLREFISRLLEWGLSHVVVWSAKSYIGLWKGSRCWCPIWPRKDAQGRIYLPLPVGWDDGSEDAAPKQFEPIRNELQKLGVSLVWAWTYNAGSNPLALTLRTEHLNQPAVRALLENSWKAL